MTAPTIDELRRLTKKAGLKFTRTPKNQKTKGYRIGPFPWPVVRWIDVRTGNLGAIMYGKDYLCTPHPMDKCEAKLLLLGVIQMKESGELIEAV